MIWFTMKLPTRDSISLLSLDFYIFIRRGKEQNREEGEMAQTKLGGGRNRGKKEGGGRKRNVTF